MPLEAKPLFRPDVLRKQLAYFNLPEAVKSLRPDLAKWAELIDSGAVDKLKEQEILPDFLTFFFGKLLGYTGHADDLTRHTLSREQHVQVDGKFADAVLGVFEKDHFLPIVAIEGKGPLDPLNVETFRDNIKPREVSPMSTLALHHIPAAFRLPENYVISC